MFKNIKLATQIIGLTIFSTVVIAFLSVYSISTVQKIGDYLLDIDRTSAPVNKAIGNLVKYWAKQEEMMYQAFHEEENGTKEGFYRAISEFRSVGEKADAEFNLGEKALTAAHQAASADVRDASEQLKVTLLEFKQRYGQFAADAQNVFTLLSAQMLQTGSGIPGRKDNPAPALEAPTREAVKQAVTRALDQVEAAEKAVHEKAGTLLEQMGDLTHTAVVQAEIVEQNAHRHLIILAVICVLFSLAIGLAISQSIVRRLKTTVTVIQHMAEGDLSHELAVTRNDEIGAVGEAIQRMQANLKGAVRVAESISKGDLDVEPVILSERDTLGYALRNMIANLWTIVGNLKTIAGHLAAGSAQLRVAARQISEGATNQASSVEETSAAMEQMTAGIKQNAKNAEETEKIATEVAEDAKKSAQSVQRTAGSMKGIAEKIGIVEEITRKTELLALNASVEAARAGEHGKGFAVVASEVSKLAEISRQAASEIVQSSRDGKEVSEVTSRMLTQLLGEIEKTKDLVQGISASSEEQSIGASQISLAIQQLDKVTQQNASASEEMASTADSLAAQAQELERTIGFFKIGYQGNSVSGQETRDLPFSQRAASSPGVHFKPEPQRFPRQGIGASLVSRAGTTDGEGNGDIVDRDFKKY